jgi:protein-S-isoprenylcysteine O-methyltransferase Ste14
MMTTIEQVVRWAGALMVAVTLAVIFWGLGRALRRPPGRTTGQAGKFLHLWFYLLIGIPFFGVAFLLWRPLPLTLSPPARIAALIVGALLYFPGLALTLWARLTLGKMYNVSTIAGAQLYADQRLITRGPFAIVRHPMYLGLMLASLGGLLLYRTWTVVFTLTFWGLFVRARREETALAAEFGAQWEEYKRRVPGWIPRLRGKR